MVKITLLGTGGDAYTIARQIRGSGGIIIEMEGTQLHIDPGPGALPAAKNAGVDLRKTAAILVSNDHLHTAGDLNAVISAMTYDGFDRHGVVLASESVINGRDDIPPMLRPDYADMVERAISLQGVPRVGINNVTIYITKAEHEDPSAVGFQFVAGKDRVSYTGDTGLTLEVIAAHKGADVLIANMPLPEDELSARRLNVVGVTELVNKINPKTLILTRFGQQLLKQDVRAVGRKMAQKVKCHVIIAEDGVTIDTSTYR